MKCRLVVSGCAGLVLILGAALASLVTAGPAIQVPATTYAFANPELQGPPCGSQVLEVSAQGNKTRLTLLNHAWMVSEDSRLSGQATVDVEVNINNVSGHIDAHGSLVLEPSGYAGSWEADFNISAPRGKLIDLNGVVIAKDSHMNARGTGELAGQWFFFEHGLAIGPPPYDIPVTDPDGQGGCDFQGEVWTGRILDPNAGP